MGPSEERVALFRQIADTFDSEGIFYALRAFPSALTSDFRDLDMAVYDVDKSRILRIVRAQIAASDNYAMRTVYGIATMCVIISYRGAEGIEILAMDFVDPLMCNWDFRPKILPNDSLDTFVDKRGFRFVSLSDQIVLRAIKNLGEGLEACSKLVRSYRCEKYSQEPLDRTRIAKLLGHYIGEHLALELCDILECHVELEGISNWYKHSKLMLNRYLWSHPWEPVQHTWNKLYYSYVRLCTPTIKISTSENFMMDSVAREDFALIRKFMKSTCVIYRDTPLWKKLWYRFQARRNWGVVFDAVHCKESAVLEPRLIEQFFQQLKVWSQKFEASS